MNNQPTADTFATFAEDGRAISDGNPIGAQPTKSGRGRRAWRGAWEERSLMRCLDG